MPSQAEIEQYRGDVDEVSALAVAEVAALVMAMSGDDDGGDGLVAAVPAALQRYMSAATQLAVNWYRGLARDQPRTPEPVPGAPKPLVGPTDRISLLNARDFQPRPAQLPPREQIESSVRWALYTPPEPEPRDTSELEPGDMSEGELQREVHRLRGTEPVAEQPVAEQPGDEAAAPAREVVVDNAPEEPRARVVAPEEGSPSARVIPAETSSRAQIIPAEASPEQARVISRLAGATQRFVTNSARDTITSNAKREGARWIRQAQPDACAFCRLLATRGYLDGGYLTEASATFVGASGRVRGDRAKGEKYHDDCSCEAVPIRAGDSYEPPEHVSRWASQYYDAYDAGNGDFRAILSAMRAAEKEHSGNTH